jgi:hypothetical protein
VRSLAAAVDLHRAGQARLDREAGALALVVERDDRLLLGTRADQRHVGSEDVDQLRQLVEAGPPQEPPNPRHPRVVGNLEHRLVELLQVDQLGEALLGVGDHRAELEHRERLAVLAGAPLAEEDGTPGVEEDQEGDRQQQRREQGEHDDGDGQVERPLQHQRRPGGVGEAEVEDRQLGQAVELDAGTEQTEVLGQEGEPQAGGLALLDQPLGGWLAHLLGGDHDPLDAVLAGNSREVLDRSQARQLTRVRRSLPVLGRGEEADESQAGLGVGCDPAGDHLRRRCGADHHSVGDAGEAMPGEAQQSPQREGADQRADADQDRAPGRQGPGRAERQQAVEGEDAEGGGGDQGCELVQRAVPDPAVVVVVEAVQLQHEDPDRAEEGGPEERADVGRLRRHCRDAERDEQRRPVAEGEQPPAQAAAATGVDRRDAALGLGSARRGRLAPLRCRGLRGAVL